MKKISQISVEYRKPLIVLATLLISIFFITVSTIHFLWKLNIFLPWGAELLDAALLTFLLFPVGYFFVFRPLVLTIIERDQAEERLRKAHAELEIRVKKRTTELALVNEYLQSEINERNRAEEALKASLGRLRQTMAGVIQTLEMMVEARDPYTAGHQRRVSNLARTIANEMKLQKDQIEGIRLAGIIHDIGMLSIPTEIIKKTDPLTDKEYDKIKTHTKVAFEILKTIDFPWPIAQIVFQHHERMNGSGYPLKLSGENILVEARVLAVADVVEAMTSYRHYRPPHTIDEALEEISSNKGILYDADVVEACIKIFTEKRFKL